MWLLWVIFCVGVGAFASKKGRSGLGWFLLSLLISPLISAIILACLKDLNVESDVQQIKMEQQQVKDRIASDERFYEYRFSRVENDLNRLQQGNNVHQPTGLHNSDKRYLPDEDTKHCPYCGNIIKREAIKCRFCGEMLEPVKTKECPFCKETIMQDAIICKYCKSNLAPVNETNIQSIKRNE